ncbi:MAG TPA: TlpA disulfide reductase family protein, partial [Candidatus Aquicultoraceae bacterium]|nr:TlpA disulfide reductase family protein [Candidatus Aquicultoraceae bacterium]
MGTTLRTAAGLALILLAAASPANLPPAPVAVARAVASEAAVPLPDFTLPDRDGNPVSLRQFIGKKPVLLAFWATWCPQCRESIPVLNRMHADPSASEDVQILALDFLESRRKVSAFIESRKVKYPVLLDGDGEVTRSFGVVGIPTYILIDRNGRVVYDGHEI